MVYAADPEKGVGRKPQDLIGGCVNPKTRKDDVHPLQNVWTGFSRITHDIFAHLRERK